MVHCRAKSTDCAVPPTGLFLTPRGPLHQGFSTKVLDAERSYLPQGYKLDVILIGSTVTRSDRSALSFRHAFGRRTASYAFEQVRTSRAVSAWPKPTNRRLGRSAPPLSRGPPTVPESPDRLWHAGVHRLVSRFRSSHHFAAPSFANFEIEGHQQLIGTSVALVQKSA